MKNSLLESYALSPKITLKNKIIMAPMTRRFSKLNGVPCQKSTEYYSKRADAGLIITEGTLISEDAIGYGNIPGIYNSEQISEWRKITDAVHIRGGVIFLQIWHCGRVSHSSFHNGSPPVSPSITIMNTPLGNSGFNCEVSRAASKNEIEALIKDYGIASKNAIAAGFDGVEIHGANGYLIDQFLHYCTNKSDDQYGGSPENMSRFCIDVVNRCCEEIGADRVGLRLSPAGHMSEITTHPKDKDTYISLFKNLRKICYIHTGNFDDSIIYPELNRKTMTQFIRDNYGGTVIASGGYQEREALEFINSNQSNLVSFGRPFIANPDLVKKIKENRPWSIYKKHMLTDLV